MKIRILLVDDHSFIRRALKISLGDESALEIVGEAENGQFAIAQVESLQPDVVLMDIQMPVMDGLEAIAQIRLDPSLIEIPIVALTALAMEGDRDRCLAAGANEYISKPIRLKQLDLLMQKLL